MSAKLRLITGASTCLGRATAARLAAKEASVDYRHAKVSDIRGVPKVFATAIDDIEIT